MIRIRFANCLAQFLGKLFHQFRAAMKSSRSILKDGYSPLAVISVGDQRLNCIERWIKIHLPGRYHAGRGAQDGYVVVQEANASDL